MSLIACNKFNRYFIFLKKIVYYVNQNICKVLSKRATVIVYWNVRLVRDEVEIFQLPRFCYGRLITVYSITFFAQSLIRKELALK
jgi:hypothetical protein